MNPILVAEMDQKSDSHYRPGSVFHNGVASVVTNRNEEVSHSRSRDSRKPGCIFENRRKSHQVNKEDKTMTFSEENSQRRP